MLGATSQLIGAGQPVVVAHADLRTDHEVGFAAAIGGAIGRLAAAHAISSATRQPWSNRPKDFPRSPRFRTASTVSAGWKCLDWMYDRQPGPPNAVVGSGLIRQREPGGDRGRERAQQQAVQGLGE